MHILLVTEDPTITSSIERAMRTKTIKIEVTRANQALEFAETCNYSIVLLDFNLQEGGRLLKALKSDAMENKMPVLMFSHPQATAKPDHAQVIAAFDAHADDCFVSGQQEGFYEELNARIRALIRRSKGHAHNVIEAAGISMDLTTRDVSVDGKRVRLAPRQFQLLELILLGNGTIVTRQMINDHLYGNKEPPSNNAIDVLMMRLREKLEASDRVGYTSRIGTNNGQGYVIIPHLA